MIKTARLLPNLKKKGADELTRRAAEWLAANRISVGLLKESAVQLNLNQYALPEEGFGNADVMICLGGDGTILMAARMTADFGTPILGVNLGKFGFMSSAEPQAMEAALSAVIRGDCIIEERMMLNAKALRKGKVIAEANALNECVIHRQVSESMLYLRVSLNGYRIADYHSDGAIISTPTGSTAYNISVGGPIVDPTMQLMIVNAICPHTLNARPFIAGHQSEITIVLESELDASLVIDGVREAVMQRGDTLTATKSKATTKLILLDKNDYCRKLSKEFQYGATTIQQP